MKKIFGLDKIACDIILGVIVKRRLELQQDSPVETGYFWLSSRYYSPELCKFIQAADVSALMQLTSISVGDGNCAYAGEDYYELRKVFDL